MKFWHKKAKSLIPRTTDAQRGNNLHCTGKNSLPIPNFWYDRSIFRLPHQPKFSDIFELCLHWVSEVCAISLHPTFKSQPKINILKSYNTLSKFSEINPILKVSLKLIICVNPRILDNQWIDTCLHTCHAHINFIIRSVCEIDTLTLFYLVFSSFFSQEIIWFL